MAISASSSSCGTKTAFVSGAPANGSFSVVSAGFSGGNAFSSCTGDITITIDFSGATDQSGTIRIDDFSINGSTAATTPPAAPTSPTATLVCGSGTSNISFTAVSGATGYRLYDVASGGTKIGADRTSLPITTPSISTSTSYWVSSYNANGESARTQVDVTVETPPSAPTITAAGPLTFCSGGSVVLQGPSSKTAYLWSNGATTQNITATTAGMYTLQVKEGGTCFSPASNGLTVTITSAPAAPSITSPQWRAGSGTIVLSPTGSPGGYELYDAATGGTRLDSGGTTLTTPTLTGIDTLYVGATQPPASGGCRSATRTAVVVGINDVPVVTSQAASALGTNMATLNGTVVYDRGLTLIERGFVYSTVNGFNPALSGVKVIDGTGLGSFSEAITPLAANATYHYVAYATNSAGTAYGAQQSFSTATVSCGATGTPTWNFASTSISSGSMTNLTVSAVSIGNSLGTVSGPLNSSVPSSGYTGASGTNNYGNACRIGALDVNANGSAYIEFTLTPQNGKTFRFTALQTGMRSTTTGPQAYALRSSANGYSTDILTGSVANNSSWTLKSHTFNVTISSATTFRIYGYNGTGSPGSGIINWRIDDLRLTVEEITNPPTLTSAIYAGNLCGGLRFKYTPVIDSTSATYTWLRRETLGITNAQATGSGPVDELLVNNTSAPVDVVYLFTLTNGSCVNYENVRVTVYPYVDKPTLSLGNGAVVCSGTLVTYTNPPGCSGCTYVWNDGNVGTTRTIADGNQTFYVLVTSPLGCEISSDTINVRGGTQGTWLGITANWNSASNWCGGVPTSSTDAIVPLNNFFEPTISGTASVRNMTIESGARVFVLSSGTLNLYGNVSGPGELNGDPGYTLRLVGSGAQVVDNVTKVGNLVLNNAAGVSTSTPWDVLNGVTFTMGNLTTSSYVSLWTTCSNLNENANSRIIGRVITAPRNVGTGSLNLLGVIIEPGTDNLGNVTIERRNEIASFNGNTGINHIWGIESANPPVSGRKIRFQWGAWADNGKNTSLMRVFFRETPSDPWSKLGPLRPISSRDIDVTTTHFSEWTVTDENNPLPVVLGQLTGKREGSTNTLFWTTLSEKNVKGFAIEKSLDGREFSQVAFVEGRGESTSRQDYRWSETSWNEQSYFRLKMVDVDGSFEYTPSIRVGGKAASEYRLFPNPAKDQVHLMLLGTAAASERIQAALYAADGTLVSESSGTMAELNTWLNGKLGDIGKGIYLIRLQREGESQVLKLIKEN